MHTVRQNKGVVYIEDHKTNPVTRIMTGRHTAIGIQEALERVNGTADDITIEIDDFGRQKTQVKTVVETD